MHKRNSSKKNSKKTGVSGKSSKNKKKEKQSENHGASGESPKSKSDLEADFCKWIPDSKMFISVNFGFLKLGSLCNASESNAFSSAYCNITQIRNPKKGLYTMNIKTLFSEGIELIKKIRTNESGLDSKSNLAKKKLKCFFENKGKHEESLLKILLGYKKVKSPQANDEKEEEKRYSEIEMTVALAEHLFKWLAPGESYAIDSRSHGKENLKRCPCGSDICEDDATLFGKTGIGHKDVWHGFIDIMLTSKPSSGVVSIGKRNIIEVKRSMSQPNIADQAVAETIVFSFLQKTKYPDIFIPNILFSPREFRIIMYDSVKDILICSQPLDLFKSTTKSTLSLDSTSIIILWIVLHYEFFSSNVQSHFTKEGYDMETFHAKFKKRATEEKFPFYDTCLKFGKEKFTVDPKEQFPSTDQLSAMLKNNVRI